MALFSFLDRERSVAHAGYSRWLVPPASLAIHLSIGQVYAFSVFKNPLTQLIGHDHSAPGDWSPESIAWVFSIAIAVLGLSTALFGKWLDRVGPRKVMFVAACFFGGGFIIAALGVDLHWLWLIYFGYGVVGGIGLGLGYLAPVGNLVRWFSDRPGLATGMAIMGFGGGALIGSPLATTLMAHFKSATSPGVSETFVVMGVIYFAFMMFGALTIRIPPEGYRPAGQVAAPKPGALGTRSVPLANAVRSPQFYLLWLVLCLNTTAGISIIEQASPLLQELFKNTFDSPAAATAAATGFVGFISLFNMGGRFVWSTLSDYIGRKATFAIFFVLGTILYASLTHLGNLALFVAAVGVLLSVYGGGFATMPAYLRDLFGTRDLNAIYGRLLTAWSVAGVVGPQLVNHLRTAQLAGGASLTSAYTTIFYVMAGLLVVGLICDLLVRPLHESKSTEHPSTAKVHA